MITPQTGTMQKPLGPERTENSKIWVVEILGIYFGL